MKLPDEYKPIRLEYSDMGSKIYAIFEKYDRQMFADIRGFGFLTGTAAQNLKLEKAYAIQDAWGKKICDLYNNHRAVEQELIALRQAVVDLARPRLADEGKDWALTKHSALIDRAREQQTRKEGE